MTDTQSLPTWSVTDVHDSLTSRSFVAALEQLGAEVSRLEALYDELDIRGGAEGTVPTVDSATGDRADRAISAFNATVAQMEVLEAYVYATVSTDTRQQ